MDWRLHSVVRKTVAVVCMALAVMLSGQAYISLLDQVEHAHHHAHFANPFAGTLLCDGDTNPCGHHENGAQQAAHHHDHGQQQAAHHHDHDSQGPADHQHGDATIMFLAAQSFVLSVRPLAAERPVAAPSKFVSFTPRGPDHPPKLNLETRV